jgi:hypothetical protein
MYSGDPPPVFNLAVCESRTTINPQVARSLAGAAPRSFWLNRLGLGFDSQPLRLVARSRV